MYKSIRVESFSRREMSRGFLSSGALPGRMGHARDSSPRVEGG